MARKKRPTEPTNVVALKLVESPANLVITDEKLKEALSEVEKELSEANMHLGIITFHLGAITEEQGACYGHIKRLVAKKEKLIHKAATAFALKADGTWSYDPNNHQFVQSK